MIITLYGNLRFNNNNNFTLKLFESESLILRIFFDEILRKLILKK